MNLATECTENDFRRLNGYQKNDYNTDLHIESIYMYTKTMRDI